VHTVHIVSFASVANINMHSCIILLHVTMQGQHVYQVFYWKYGTDEKEKGYRACDLPSNNYSTAANAAIGSWHLIDEEED
jgi:hypothetical protein